MVFRLEKRNAGSEEERRRVQAPDDRAGYAEVEKLNSEVLVTK
jgi:hypothetical protein